MKKYVLFFVAVMGVLGTMALPVDSKRAVEVANRFWNAQGCKGMLVERPTAFAHLHLFVGDEGGFVVVSADDVARPVLAWSADAPVGDTLHAAVDEWLASYYAGNNVPVTISAVPFDSTCSFLQWNDGNTDNPRVVQLTSISARFDHWNCDTAGLYFNPINPEAVSVRNVVHDTVNLEAVFVPVHDGDTLRYDNGGDNGFGWGYPTLYDTSRHYRWAVKYDPAVLRGVSHIEQVEAYLPYERDANDHSVQCNYTVQVYQGGEDGPQTLLGTRVVATGYQSRIAYLSNHYDGDMWRRATFYPPLAIDSTQPVWVVLNCTSSRQSYLSGISRWSAMRASFYSGNPNSNYETGWTHYTAFSHNQFTFDPEYENHHHSWRIRSVTSNAKATVKTRPNDIGAGEYPVGFTATVTMSASNRPSGYLFDHWEWYSTEDPSIHGTSTDNPVTFTVTGDVVCISHCVPDQSLLHVNARPNNNAWGTVMGSGDYHAGDIVTLMAMPNSGYHFKWWMYPGWGEQYVDNPFVLTLGQDAAGVTIDIVGYFEADEEPPVGIEEVETGGITLYPNPANSTFTVFGLRPGVVVELLAIDGCRIGAWIAEGDNLVVDVSQIPVGNYLLRTEGVVRRIAIAR